MKHAAVEGCYALVDMIVADRSESDNKGHPWRMTNEGCDHWVTKESMV